MTKIGLLHKYRLYNEAGEAQCCVIPARGYVFIFPYNEYYMRFKGDYDMQKFEELKRVCKWFTEEELACVENQATTNMQLTNTIQQARRLLKYRVN